MNRLKHSHALGVEKPSLHAPYGLYHPVTLSATCPRTADLGQPHAPHRAAAKVPLWQQPRRDGRYSRLHLLLSRRRDGRHLHLLRLRPGQPRRDPGLEQRGGGGAPG